MDAKVAYWTGALLNMVVLVALAALGIRRVRERAVATHRTLMLTAAALVGLFLASYGFKVAFLGREALGSWDRFYVQVLRFHETCVLFMVAAGGYAIFLALRNRIDATPGDPAVLRRHRLAGWTAFFSSALAVASASVVLFGMYARL